MAGRKQGSVFGEQGFQSAKINGKYVAICIICNKKLQNTASVRLMKHRNVCKIGWDSRSLPEKSENIEKETLSQSSIQLKTELTENYEDEMQFDNNFQATHEDKDSKTSDKDEKDSNLYDEQVKNIQDYVAENPLSPAFKSNILNNETDDIDIEDDEIFMQKLKLRKQTEKRCIRVSSAATVSSRKLLNLQEEKMKAETFYFRKKGEFFQKQIDNLDIQRKLMILQAQKLRLEIESIRNDY